MDIKEHEFLHRRDSRGGNHGAGSVDVNQDGRGVGNGRDDQVGDASDSLSLYCEGSPVVSTIRPNHDIVFYCGKEEAIKVSPDGFFVKGKLIARDLDLYRAFCEFFHFHGHYDAKPDGPIGDAYTVEPDGSHKATVHYGFCMAAYSLEEHCHDCFALDDCIAMARKDGIVVKTPADNVV